LMGRANWWAPVPLRRLHERIGLGEGGGDTDRHSSSDPISDFVNA